MDNEKELYSLLAEWYPKGNFSEADLWEAIAESNGLDYDPSDGDLADWL